MAAVSVFTLVKGRTLRYGGQGLGIFIILLAVATHIWSLNVVTVFEWIERSFGPLFLSVYGTLVALGAVAIIQIKSSPRGEVWFEVGTQAAGGIATLSLTFTLLGISLGIESLSQQPLSPETIGKVIQTLTKHFSTAFLTTILGLPTANLIRSILSVRWASIESNKQ